MGRTKGSKNKPKDKVSSPEAVSLADSIEVKNISPDNDTKQGLDTASPIKRGRGRPKGSKKQLPDGSQLEIKKDNTLLIGLFGNVKKIKREIRRLKKIKLQCRAGTKERIELYRKIKDLKAALLEAKNSVQSQSLKPSVIDTKKESVKEVIEPKINYPDDNGCIYFNYCKRVNKEELVNSTCFNAIYFMDKLERKCTQLNNN